MRSIIRPQCAAGARIATGAGIAATAGIVAGLGVLAGGVVEARFPVQRVYHLPVLPHGVGPLRIVQISDVHMHAGSKWQIPWIHSLLDLDPDMIVVTGDNLSDAAGLDVLREAFAPFAGIPGAFVYGSNDYYSAIPALPTKYVRALGTRVKRWIRTQCGRTQPREQPNVGRTPLRHTPDLPHREMAEFFRHLGWVDVRNAHAHMDVVAHTMRPVTTHTSAYSRPVRVSLSGVDDPHINYDDEAGVDTQWDEADVRIGVTHAPYARVLDQMTALGTDVILAGHTHGGQVCLPVGRALVNNTDIPLSHSGGLTRWTLGEVPDPVMHTDWGVPRALPSLNCPVRRTTWLHVSRGLGTSKYTPVRLFCRPETSVVVLEEKE